MTALKRLKKQLLGYTGGDDEVSAVAEAIGALEEGPYSFGISLIGVRTVLATRGERMLLDGNERGWSYLLAAIRVEVLSSLLALDAAATRTQARAAVQCVYSGDSQTAEMLVAVMAAGLEGKWQECRKVFPSATELEALAVHLVTPYRNRTVALKRVAELGAMPLEQLAPAMGAPEEDGVSPSEVVADAFEYHLSLCREGKGVPIGSRLSCAIPYSILTYRQNNNLAELKRPCHVLDVPPFNDYERLRDVEPIDLLGQICDCAARFLDPSQVPAWMGTSEESHPG